MFSDNICYPGLPEAVLTPRGSSLAAIPKRVGSHLAADEVVAEVEVGESLVCLHVLDEVGRLWSKVGQIRCR